MCLKSQSVTANYSKVRWSGEHVPGSPFVTMIFDTEEELARFTPNLNDMTHFHQKPAVALMFFFFQMAIFVSDQWEHFPGFYKAATPHLDKQISLSSMAASVCDLDCNKFVKGKK